MVYTMPEFLEKRFSASSRYLLSAVSLIAYVLTKIAVGIFAGGVVFATLMPELEVRLGGATLNSFWIGSVGVIVLTGAYTILGGLRAVAYTEALQTIILVLGSVLVTVFGLRALGGWGELREIAGSEMFNLWKPLVPAGVEGTWRPVFERAADGRVVRQAWYFNANYPWLGMLFCAPITGLWYWCTDQYIVQRTLGARNEQQARRGSIFAAFLKLLPVFIFIIPGIICFALAASGQNAALQQAMYRDGELIRERTQAAFPLMVQHVLPVGVRGIVVAGLLAALMSSLAGVFNASSTLFTMDLYQKVRPRVTQAELVWVGRLATGGMVLIGLAWVPGCLASLLTGFALGMFRLLVDTPISLKLPGYEQGYAEGSFLWIVNNIYFQYYSLLIFLISAAVLVVVSYATAPPDPAQIEGLTYATVNAEDRRLSRSSWNRVDGVASVGGL
ncbi:hypothetical protein HK102_011152, partial [Quaeritorhiza haematococci]